MKNQFLPFFCGLLVGAVATSAAWSFSSSAPASEGVGFAKPVPVDTVVAAEPVPAPAEPVPALAEPVPAPAEGAGLAESVPAAEPPAPGEPAPPEAERRPRRGPPRWDEMTEEQRDEMRQRFRRMHDERTTRVVDGFVERNGLAPEDGERLFAVADAMNERALARVQLWTEYVRLQGRERISRDQGAQMMRDLFDDLVKGYEELDAAFGEGWREKDPDFDLGQMVDPDVWGSLFRLGGGPGGPGGGPRGPRGGGPRGAADGRGPGR